MKTRKLYAFEVGGGGEGCGRREKEREREKEVGSEGIEKKGEGGEGGVDWIGRTHKFLVNVSRCP